MPEIYKNLNPETMFSSLRGKVAFITGGNSGLGRAIAEQFAAAGIKVVITGRNETTLQETVEGIVQNGGEAAYCVTDVRSAEQIKKAVDFTVEKYGKLNFVVNNAGGGIGSHPIHEIPAEMTDMALETLLHSVAYGMTYGIEAILRTKGNREFCSVINVASGAGLRSSAGLSQYSAAKHGVLGMTKACANEYARHNITVNAICPGTFKTNIFNNVPEDRMKIYEDIMPQGRLGDPVEIGHLALFLVSDMAHAINGACIPIDGGMVGSDNNPVRWEHPEIED